MENKGKSISYLTKEGFHNVWINRMMSVASVAVLTSCLTLMGCVTMLLLNVDVVFEKIGDQNVIMAFVDQNLDGETTELVGENLGKISNISSVTFVSREEAWADQVESLGEDNAILEGIENPLPNAYKLTVENLELFESTVAEVKAVENVLEVRENSYLASQLSQISQSVSSASVGMILLLFLVSLFIISNTVRITMFNRRLEIGIMKSVGATNGFIRWPFMIEGMVLGVVSAVLSVILVGIIYYAVAGAFSDLISVMGVRPLSFGGYWWKMLLFFIAAGVLTGVFGSFVSMSRYLTEQKGESDEI